MEKFLEFQAQPTEKSRDEGSRSPQLRVSSPNFEEEMMVFAQEGDMVNMQALFQVMDLNKLKKLRNTADGEYGRMLLHHCCIHGHVDMVRLLLNEGFSPNVHDGPYTLVTPLMEACKAASIEVAGLLLEAGAQVMTADASNETALFYAARYANAIFTRKFTEICRHQGGMSGEDLKGLLIHKNDRGRIAEDVAQNSTLKGLLRRYRTGEELIGKKRQKQRKRAGKKAENGRQKG